MHIRWNSGIGSPDGNGAWHAFKLEKGCQGEGARYVLPTRQFQTDLLFERLPNALVLSLDPLSVLCQISAFLHGTGRTEPGSYRVRQLRCAYHVEITFEGGNVVWRTPNLMH
jgi:hypothetical protein